MCVSCRTLIFLVSRSAIQSLCFSLALRLWKELDCERMIVTKPPSSSGPAANQQSRTCTPIDWLKYKNSAVSAVFYNMCSYTDCVQNSKGSHINYSTSGNDYLDF